MSYDEKRLYQEWLLLQSTFSYTASCHYTWQPFLTLLLTVELMNSSQCIKFKFIILSLYGILISVDGKKWILKDICQMILVGN